MSRDRIPHSTFCSLLFAIHFNELLLRHVTEITPYALLTTSKPELVVRVRSSAVPRRNTYALVEFVP
jgi:hypothetical protein